MLWRVYVALHAIVVALALAVGVTWVARMRLDLDRWPSIVTFLSVVALSTVAAYLWMQTSSSTQLRRRAWRSLRVQFLMLGAAAAFFAVTDVTHLFSADAPAHVPSAAVRAEVLRVVDGDTIVVKEGDEEARVRYIGMDTPETTDPSVGIEPYGIEAAAFNRELVEGKEVWLEKDVSETDQYGRLLRYVWLPDGRMVNMVLVKEGFATVYTWPPDVRYQEDFHLAEQEARRLNKGLWSGQRASRF